MPKSNLQRDSRLFYSSSRLSKDWQNNNDRLRPRELPNKQQRNNKLSRKFKEEWQLSKNKPDLPSSDANKRSYANRKKLDKERRQLVGPKRPARRRHAGLLRQGQRKSARLLQPPSKDNWNSSARLRKPAALKSFVNKSARPPSKLSESDKLN